METHNFCNIIVIPPWTLRANLAKKASSVEEIFVTVREASISSDNFLHEESELEEPQPPAEEGDMVKLAATFFQHLFV